MKQKYVDKNTVSGIVERRKFDSKKLEVLKFAIKLGIDAKELNVIEKWAAKPQFKNNFIWKFLNKVFKIDIQIPVLTGFWTIGAIAHNTITTKGKEVCAKQVGGVTSAPVTAIAIGIGSPSATALGSEITTNGGARGAATVTNETTDTTGDTCQWVKTYSFLGSFAVTEEGLFDNNTSGGNMLASQSFSAVNVANGDSLQVTHKVKFA